MMSDGAEIILKKPTCFVHGDGGEGVVKKRWWSNKGTRGARRWEHRTDERNKADLRFFVLSLDVSIRPYIQSAGGRTCVQLNNRCINYTRRTTAASYCRTCLERRNPRLLIRVVIISIQRLLTRPISDRSRTQANNDTAESAALDTCIGSEPRL